MLNWIELTRACAKGFLILLNIICIMIAVSTFGFAVADTRILKQYGEEDTAGRFTGDMVIIAACILLGAVAVLGCVGTMRNSVKMLYIYVISLMVLVMLELLIAIYVSVVRYGLQFRVSEWLREDFFNNSTSETRATHDKLWDDLQTNYECCGLNGPEDYAAIRKPISVSCCSRAYRARTAAAQLNLYRTCIESDSYFHDGCEGEVLDVLKADADWLFGVAVTSFWFEPVGILRDDGKRPDGITLIPWERGRALVWDATCVDTLAPSRLSGSVLRAGAAAEAAEGTKRYNGHAPSHVGGKSHQ